MSEFVQITKQDFEKFLQNSFNIVDNPQSKEIIYDIPTQNPQIILRIYSSIDIDSGISRNLGDDAIRCVLIDQSSNKPIDKGKRTHRMSNWKERLKEKLEQLNQEVNLLKFCKTCNSVMTLREGKFGKFYSCIRYPLCMTTMDLNGKYKEKIQSSVTLNEPQKIVKCPICDAPMKKRTGRRGDFYGCTNFMKTGCRGTRQVNDVEIYEQGVEKEIQVNHDVQEEDTIEDLNVDIPEDSHIELIETSKYPHMKFKFEKFNPIQSRVFHCYDQDINLVVAASTSAGKTVIAEMLMADSVSKGKKAIFLSPLKAVSLEKFADWTNEKHDWSKLKVSIVTGDYQLTEKRVQELNEANIIIMTTEMMDSRTRRIETEKNDWLLKAETVVYDEVHLLTTNRGAAVESSIMRFTRQNPKCRIVFLSATMPNVSQMTGWLTSLNGKKTELINSAYRPITLDKHYLNYYDHGRYAEVEQNKIEKALEIILEKTSNNEQCIVFVHAKNTGRIIAQRLEELNINVKFYFADLKLNERKEIELKTRTKEIQVLVSTSCLAWGVNI